MRAARVEDLLPALEIRRFPKMKAPDLVGQAPDRLIVDYK